MHLGATPIMGRKTAARHIGYDRPMDYDALMVRLEGLGSAPNPTGMARYGNNTARAFGISAPELKAVAKGVGRDHALAGRLWASGIHEARMLATLIDEPAKVSAAQMDAWVADFDSWDLCDGACGKLFWRTPHARGKVVEWTAREPEFVRRAGFALIAWLAVHDKKGGRCRLCRLPAADRGQRRR